MVSNTLLYIWASSQAGPPGQGQELWGNKADYAEHDDYEEHAGHDEHDDVEHDEILTLTLKQEYSSDRQIF